MIIEALTEKDRRLRIEYNMILKQADDIGKNMLSEISVYLDEYALFNAISSDQILELYKKFLACYSSDIQHFIETGLYPVQSGRSAEFSRIEYDFALILSVFFAPVRYHIFRNMITETGKTSGYILLIGIGAAIELVILNAFYPGRHITAYDLSINPFVKHRFNQINLQEKLYPFNENSKYGLILALELLEHLEKPYEFMADASKVLTANASMLCTTASNMPQFDHLYNFISDNFSEKVIPSGFCTEFSVELNHQMMNSDFKSFNTFYHLRKCNYYAARRYKTK